MKELNLMSDELRKNISDLLIPLQCKRILSEEAFDALNRSVILLTKALKGTDLISKSLINELYCAVKVLRTEAPYMKEKTARLESMANQIHYSFDLILNNECHEDRKSGVPRII